MAYSQEATDLDEFIFGTDCTTVESSRLLAMYKGTYEEVAEWTKAAVLKTAGCKKPRGFEPHSLRQSRWTIPPASRIFHLSEARASSSPLHTASPQSGPGLTTGLFKKTKIHAAKYLLPRGDSGRQFLCGEASWVFCGE